ncbi:hypothetical protein GE09DRAFT_1221373 [Coniochaeta sp. 2T2.1]|nr:hypothetical protein GE09DRAFT_1221373 [Coniochaeta sp. 2T2.1]
MPILPFRLTTSLSLSLSLSLPTTTILLLSIPITILLVQNPRYKSTIFPRLTSAIRSRSRHDALRLPPASKGGGVYVPENVFGVELDFLGLDRVRPTLRKEEVDGGGEEEDERWCYKLRHLGAVWWDEHSYDMAMWDVDWKADDPFVKVGWPATGGVWVLKTTKFEAAGRGVAVVYNAYNMEERCRAIEMLADVSNQADSK